MRQTYPVEHFHETRRIISLQIGFFVLKGSCIKSSIGDITAPIRKMLKVRIRKKEDSVHRANDDLRLVLNQVLWDLL